MFITLPSWEKTGVPKTLVSPGTPWSSVSAMIDRPIFIILPSEENERIAYGCRMFNDVMQLLTFAAEVLDHRCSIQVAVAARKKMHFAGVSAIASYPCPQTGIKNYVYIDETGMPKPADGPQPFFNPAIKFDIEIKQTISAETPTWEDSLEDTSRKERP